MKFVNERTLFLFVGIIFAIKAGLYDVEFSNNQIEDTVLSLISFCLVILCIYIRLNIIRRGD